MTIHVISVGRSILESLELPSQLVEDGASQSDIKSVVDATPQGLTSPNTQDVRRWLGTTFGSDTITEPWLVDDVIPRRPHFWESSASAEVQTFESTRDNAGASRIIPAQHTAVLIATDTSDGLRAALWNAVILSGAEVDRIRYLDEPGSPVDCPRGAVMIVRVPGLDASSTDEFAAAMRHLGALGRFLHTRVRERGEEFRFYLSGGFKAAIPYLISLAEGMRSFGDSGPVNAYVLHETAAGQRPVALPLRRFHEAKAELAPFDEAGWAEEPGGIGCPLLGYAYERRAGGRFELTAFGHGLRTLFGHPDGRDNP